MTRVGDEFQATSNGLVYGDIGDCLVILSEDYAAAVVAEIERWRAIETNVAALELVLADDGYLIPPVAEDVLQERIDEDPQDQSGGAFSLADCDSVAYREWPGIVTDAPDDWGVVDETLGGIVSDGYPRIDPSREPDILRLAERDGVAIRRDDSLVWSVTMGAGE